jgi:hypothetical protein
MVRGGYDTGRVATDLASRLPSYLAQRRTPPADADQGREAVPDGAAGGDAGGDRRGICGPGEGSGPETRAAVIASIWPGLGAAGLVLLGGVAAAAGGVVQSRLLERRVRQLAVDIDRAQRLAASEREALKVLRRHLEAVAHAAFESDERLEPVLEPLDALSACWEEVSLDIDRSVVPMEIVDLSNLCSIARLLARMVQIEAKGTLDEEVKDLLDHVHANAVKALKSVETVLQARR